LVWNGTYLVHSDSVVAGILDESIVRLFEAVEDERAEHRVRRRQEHEAHVGRGDFQILCNRVFVDADAPA